MIKLSEGSLPLRGGCVLTLGNFDGVHIGHRALIEKTAEAARECGLPALVWTFAGHPQGGGYICPEEEKAALAAAAGADMYFAADFEKYRDKSPESFVKETLVAAFGARRVLCGFNFTFGKGGEGTPATLERLLSPFGVPLTVLPPVCLDGEVVSSTGLRADLARGDMERAEKRLGRLYGFTLPVVHGRRLGRSYGCPTANQRLPFGMALPAFGVYAAFCETYGGIYRAVANIGVKPTVASDGEALCETHIFGFDGDLYGKPLSVFLYRHLRGERRFENADALFCQIEEDKAHSLAVTEGVQVKGENGCFKTELY